jgi:uncharacterized damage-inducible protein DinB
MTPPALKRPQPDEFLSYYGRYVDLVPEGDVLKTLADQGRATADFLRTLSEEKSAFRYAPDKWSIKELVGHMSDAERIFSDRALRFARRDPNDQPGFEENDYVKNGGFDAIPFKDLIGGFEAVRRSTLALLSPLTSEAASRRGKANGGEISVQALVYVIAGHERHHLNVLRSKYLA